MLENSAARLVFLVEEIGIVAISPATSYVRVPPEGAGGRRSRSSLDRPSQVLERIFYVAALEVLTSSIDRSSAACSSAPISLSLTGTTCSTVCSKVRRPVHDDAAVFDMGFERVHREKLYHLRAPGRAVRSTMERR